MGVATYTIVPANKPATQRNRIICQIVLLNPNSDTPTALPHREITITGFRPKRSAARPHPIITVICVSEKSDSCLMSARFPGMFQHAYNQTTVEAHISLFYTPSPLDHVLDKGNDAKECDWLNKTCETQDCHLPHRQRPIVLVRAIWSSVLTGLVIWGYRPRFHLCKEGCGLRRGHLGVAMKVWHRGV